MTIAHAVAHFVLALACLICGSADASPWSVSVDQRNGLPVVALGGWPAVSGQFVLLRKDGSSADIQTDFKIIAPFDYVIFGNDPTRDVRFTGRITRPSTRQLVWEFYLDISRPATDVIAGGLAFRFDLANGSSRLGEPELLPGNRGWRWGRPGASRMEMRFDPPMAEIFFERNQKSEVRALFYRGDVPEGLRRHTTTLTISDDISIAPTMAERFGLDDHTAWPTDILNWPVAPWAIAPVDLSFLNADERPAGKRGFLRADKDALVFEDGTPARFWGTSITAAALFGTDRESVRRQTRRLSELGFNLVRFTHHDSPWVNPNIFGDAKSSDNKTLDPAMLDRLDWWIKCLKDEGIYIWLDLHVQRQFKERDGIANFAEISNGGSAYLTGYNYVNDSFQESMRRFNEAYVSHLNPFTGLQYKDDPAIIAMLVTNENDITNHYGNALLPDRNIPRHTAIYMAQAAAFAAQHGLPRNTTWRSWEHGPSKLFLNDLEHRFNAAMIQHLRTLGVRTNIVPTSTWGRNPLSSLPALTSGDMIAVHSYGGAAEFDRNPIFAPNFMHWMAAAQIVDRPLSVAEWNVERFPIPDRHAMPLYIASSARLQGWDAVLQYAYAQVPLSSPGFASNWHAFNDPSLMATLPAAALLYRRQDVQEAATTYVFAPTAEQLFSQPASPANSAALRTAAERGKLMIAMPQTRELPWLEPSRIPDGATMIKDLQRPLIPDDAGEILSDTGELRRNWNDGIFSIDAPRTQAAMGFIGGKRINLRDVEIEVTTRNATVAVQSLDDNPIGASRTMLISFGARSLPISGKQVPFHSEPVTGRLTVRAAAGLKLYKRDGAGRDHELPMTYESDRYQIELDRKLGTYWLFMK